MRIGYLTYGLDRTPAGIGRYAVELVRALATFPDRPEIVLLTTEGQDQHNLWDLFEHHALPGCRLLPTLMTLGSLAIRQAISRHRLDAIHDPNGIAPLHASPVRARRIVTIHDAFAYVSPETHNWLDNWRYHHQLPSAARQADAVISVSECSRQDLIRHLGLANEQVHVIAEGVSPRFKPIADGIERQAVLDRYSIRQPYLLYVGGINARKNIARLFAAYAQLRERRPNLTLVLGGKRQWQTGEIDAALRELDLGDHVHFTGYVDDADLPALYSGAEAFVFPSLYEGFGLPPLEAMACGTPVVTSNVSSLPEVVGEAALTVDPRDVDMLAATIERALSDAMLRANLRRRGIERAAQFTWRRAARDTLALYEHVLQSNPASTSSWQ
jgi:glycosyltransferase involved in cell wall biosynthesis